MYNETLDDETLATLMSVNGETLDIEVIFFDDDTFIIALNGREDDKDPYGMAHNTLGLESNQINLDGDIYEFKISGKKLTLTNQYVTFTLTKQ